MFTFVRNIIFSTLMVILFLTPVLCLCTFNWYQLFRHSFLNVYIVFMKGELTFYNIL